MLTQFNQFDPERAFGWIDFGERNSVVIAVSGGSDSTALLIAFKQWAEKTVPRLRLVCATVDHGLRPESVNEARHVAVFCQRLGITHHTLNWEGEKPKTGLAAAAREARYALLADLARQERTDIVLTGHTADDQAETVHMRRARGRNTDHGRGLAGMARITLFDGDTWIVRALLKVRREALRKILTSNGIEWIDDPTNEDESYERVGVRKLLTGDHQFEELSKIAGNATNWRRKFATDASTLIKSHGSLIAPGVVRLDQEFWGEDTARMDALRAILACSGGSKQLADRSRTSTLMRQLWEGRSCLSGCLAAKTQNGLHFCRERRKDAEIEFSGGIFDRRYRITRDSVAAGWQLALPSNPDLDANRDQSPLATTAAAMEPILIAKDSSTPPVSDNTPEIHRYLAPFDHFLPEFDLTLANAAAKLFGRDEYPPPPVVVQKYRES